MADPIDLTWNEALSGALGSISLAAWIFLLLPQLVENYRQHSADGISLTFLLIWFVGDITNLAGAVWAGLVPTVVALAVYFCFADAVLIGQCFYYYAVNKNKDNGQKQGGAAQQNGTTAGQEQSEQTPLLNGTTPAIPSHSQPKRRLTDVTEENLGLPGSHRRRSSRPSTERRTSTLDPLFASPTPRLAWLKNSLSILAICLIGAAGWALAWRTGAWRPTPVEEEVGGPRGPLGAEVLGYASAVCYLGARVPQIVKNQRERSCEGLSLLFFCLSVVGNATYGAGILFHSVQKEYFLTNLPWLIGSLGTIAEDVVIFVQFSMFGEREEEAVVEE
ncbi:uncharacterized protein LTR77_001986 [Saxophila tyrrhenica]|uniref:Vacuolar membrane PQ loop repeat protein n=1 Tax=Saxophila tyrrhenica TaxID=1690608 RepID=A0AAV9PKF0_9PEZI|nr:hypothetical protein LTR77_001986 [Saxophila tyrrhenica]